VDIKITGLHESRRITEVSDFGDLDLFGVTGYSGSNWIWAVSAFGWVRGSKPFEWLHDFKVTWWIRYVPWFVDYRGSSRLTGQCGGSYY
jgi:hypothetical protein